MGVARIDHMTSEKGQKRRYDARLQNFRFASTSRHLAAPRRQKRGPIPDSCSAASLDHLIGAAEDWRWDRKTERLGGLEI